MTVRKSVRPLPSHRLALRYTSPHLDHFTFGSSSDHSSSDHSSSGHSTLDHSSSDHSSSDYSSSGHSTSSHSSSGHTPRVTTIVDSSAPSRFVYPPLARTLRSHTATMISSIHASRSLVPSRIDLLPPCKRFRDSISPEDSVEEDIDTYVLADIEADATTVKVVADMDVEAGVDAGIGMEVESNDRGTMGVGVDVVSGIDIPDGMLMPNEDIKTGQRELEARSLIASVAKALAAYEANRAAELAIESQRQNRDDDDNRNVRGNRNKNGRGNGDRNGGGNGNRNGGGNGNRNPNRNDRGTMLVARECQPLNFKGTEGVVELTRWFEKIETNTHKRTIGADAAFVMSWKELMKLMTESFQELTMLCTKMVPKEEDRVEKFIGGLPDNIQGNVFATEPMRLQYVVWIAKNLMDKKLKGYAVRNAENKRRAYTAGNNEKRGYVRALPYCNKCKLHHEGPCTVKCGKYNKVGHMARDYINAVAAIATQRALVANQRVPTCFECGRLRHYKNECPNLKNQTRRNKARNKTNEARGKGYVLGGGEANPDSNVVMGMFLLNNHNASMLFDSGADRSFVSSTFSALLDVVPSTLNVSYAVKLADRRVTKTNTILRGCTLGLLGHTFNIDLMHISYRDEVLIVQSDRSGKEKKSKLSIISCTKNKKYIMKGCQTFVEQVTKKETEDKSNEKRLEDMPIVHDFPEFFLEDLPGLPPTRQVEFQIDLVPGAALVARAPYILAPLKLKSYLLSCKNFRTKGS
ncbi:reverse transcriptase domain-containing protein [Tanacetum coccineum]